MVPDKALRIRRLVASLIADRSFALQLLDDQFSDLQAGGDPRHFLMFLRGLYAARCWALEDQAEIEDLFRDAYPSQ